jgi:hypothetical protein
VLTGLALVGAGVVVWNLPVTRRFVRTVREAATQREAELRAAVETAVRADATSRAPRYADGATTPDLEVEAGWDRDHTRRSATPLGAGDPGRSLTPEEARAVLLDPTRPRGRTAAEAAAAAETAADERAPEGR